MNQREKKICWDNIRIYQSRRECRNEGRSGNSTVMLYHQCLNYQTSGLWGTASSQLLSVHLFHSPVSANLYLCHLLRSTHTMPALALLMPSVHNSNGADCRFWGERIWSVHLEPMWSTSVHLCSDGQTGSCAVLWSGHLAYPTGATWELPLRRDQGVYLKVSSREEMAVGGNVGPFSCCEWLNKYPGVYSPQQ